MSLKATPTDFDHMLAAENPLITPLVLVSVLKPWQQRVRGLIASITKSGGLSSAKTGFLQMRFKSEYWLNTPTHTQTHRFAFILSIHLSCPCDKPKVSKGLRAVGTRRNLHAQSVVSGDITSDLGSVQHYHHQRSDITDNFVSSLQRSWTSHTHNDI